MFEKYKYIFLVLVVAIVAGISGYFLYPEKQNIVTVFVPTNQTKDLQNIKNPVDTTSTPNKLTSNPVENVPVSVETLLDIGKTPNFLQIDNNIMFLERGKNSRGISYGDFYYLSSKNQAVELAISKSIENGLATIDLNQVFFTKAQLSPKGRFVLLQADCWEESCAVIYDLQTNKRHFLPGSRSINWLENGLLEIMGECQFPSLPCGRYQSKSVDMPWELSPQRLSITRGNSDVTKELLPDACQYSFFDGRTNYNELSEKRVTYRSQEYGIELQLPYNPLWGGDTYILNPYDQKDKKILYGNILVTGEGCASWVDANEWMEILPKESKEQILSRLEALDVPSPEKLHAGLKITESVIGGKEVITYKWQALCGGGQTIVLGEKYNYGFSTICSAGGDDDTIKSIKFIQ